MAKALSTIKAEAEVVRDETTIGANTAVRVGGLFVDVVNYLANVSAVKTIASLDSVSDLPASANLGDGYYVGDDLYVYVGENGNYVGNPKYTILQGLQGLAGNDGVGIQSITTAESSVSGGTNVVTITLSDGTSSTFNVKNGTAGTAFAWAEDTSDQTNWDTDKTYIVPSGTPNVLNIYYYDGGAWALSAETITNSVTIVNDLTTGGTAVALSAEMGKVLGQRGDVYNYMTATLHKSKNLFDKNSATSGKYVNKTTGNIASFSGFYASDFMAVDGNNLYITGLYVGGGAIGGAVYNSSKTYIRSLTTAQYTYTEGDAYIRITVQDTKIDIAQVEIGTSATDYEAYFAPYYTYIFDADYFPPFEIGLDETTFYEEELGRNILDNSEIEDGYCANYNTGAKTSASGYSITPYIPMNGKNVCCLYGTNYGGTGGTAVYDENKAFLRGYQSGKAINFVSGDAYVRFTILTTYKNVATAAYFDSDGRYFPFTAYSIKNVVKENSLPSTIGIENLAFKYTETGKNKFNKNNIIQGYSLTSDGGYNKTGDEYFVTDYIRASKNGLVLNNVVLTFYNAVYDEDYNIIRVFNGQYTYVNGDVWVRFTHFYSQINTLQIEEGTTSTDYEDYTEKNVISPDVIPSSSIDYASIENALAEGKVFTDELTISLPDTLYAVVGDTLQLFFKGMVQAVNPLNYNVVVSCSKGRQFHRYFEYTPTSDDVGNTTFKVTIKDNNGNKLSQKECSLVTVAAPSSPLTNKKILCIGDSLTANGLWPAEAYRRLTGSGGTPTADGLSNIQFVGNRVKDGAYYVGNSGWSWNDYCTSGRTAYRFTIGTTPNVAIGNKYSNNGYNFYIIEISDDGTILCETTNGSTPEASGTLTLVTGTGDASVLFTAATLDSANPFWDYDNGTLTFTPFVNTYCGGSIDAVYILLGSNGLTNWRTDFSETLAYIKTFADTLHSEFPNCKLFLMNGNFPSMDLMMPGYGAAGTGYADTYGILVSLLRQNEAYQTFANGSSYSSWVKFVNLSAQFDQDYNYPLTQKDVNTRNSNYEEPYANNVIHPTTFGYYQFADAVYRSIVAEFC